MASEQEAEAVVHILAGEDQCDFCLQWWPEGLEWAGPLAFGSFRGTLRFAKCRLCSQCEEDLVNYLSKYVAPK